MMDGKIKNREIRSSDMSEINEVISFHNSAHNDSRTPDYWVWEYKGNEPDHFVFTVLKGAGQIIGTQGMIPIYINIKGKRNLSGKSENSLLNPKYRGGTLFQDLYEYAISLCKKKQMNCIWGYTSAVKVWRNKLRFSVYENIMYKSTLILNLQNILSEIKKSKRSMPKKIARNVLTMLDHSYSSLRLFSKFSKKTQKIKYSIETQLKSISDLERFYVRLREKYPNLIYIDQDQKYIKWRIYNNPNINYEMYFLYENDLLRSYCYVSKNDRRVVFLTDFTFESPEAGAFLLRNLIDKWRKKRITTVSFFGNIKNPLMITTFNLLKNFGFIKKRTSEAFVLKNISFKDKNHLYNIENWYIGGLWTEGYTY